MQLTQSDAPNGLFCVFLGWGRGEETTQKKSPLFLLDLHGGIGSPRGEQRHFGSFFSSQGITFFPFYYNSSFTPSYLFGKQPLGPLFSTVKRGLSFLSRTRCMGTSCLIYEMRAGFPLFVVAINNTPVEAVVEIIVLLGKIPSSWNNVQSNEEGYLERHGCENPGELSGHAHCMNRSIFLISRSDQKGSNPQERLGISHSHQMLRIAKSTQASVGNLSKWLEPQVFISPSHCPSVSHPNC